MSSTKILRYWRSTKKPSRE